MMIKRGKDVAKSRVLVMGATFKENVEDIRNSKVADVIQELKNFSVNVDIVDPHASSDELHHEYGFRLTAADSIRHDYDAVIVAVSHQPYVAKDEAYFKSITADNAILVDIKGLYRSKPMQELGYWSL
nr:UDP binding domain-containing protein [Hymenobacter sp. BRD67]